MGNIINDTLLTLSNWTNKFSGHLIMSIAASLLMLYGNNIMLFLKKQISSLNFFLRVSAYVLMAGVGLVFLQWILTDIFVPLIFELINPKFHFFVFASFFIAIGILAEKKRQI